MEKKTDNPICWTLFYEQFNFIVHGNSISTVSDQRNLNIEI